MLKYIGDFNRLKDFYFYKHYRYSGSIKYGIVKKLDGYQYVFYDKKENTKNCLFIIKKKDRILQDFVNEYKDLDFFSEKEISKSNEIKYNLLKNGLLEEI